MRSTRTPKGRVIPDAEREARRAWWRANPERAAEIRARGQETVKRKAEARARLAAERERT